MTNRIIRHAVVAGIIKRIDEGQVDDKVYSVAIKTAKRIFDLWCVDICCRIDILGCSQSDFDRKDVVVRVSCVLNVYPSLNTLFNNPEL